MCFHLVAVEHSNIHLRHCPLISYNFIISESIFVFIYLFINFLKSTKQQCPPCRDWCYTRTQRGSKCDQICQMKHISSDMKLIFSVGGIMTDTCSYRFLGFHHMMDHAVLLLPNTVFQSKIDFTTILMDRPI